MLLCINETQLRQLIIVCSLDKDVLLVIIVESVRAILHRLIANLHRLISFEKQRHRRTNKSAIQSRKYFSGVKQQKQQQQQQQKQQFLQAVYNYIGHIFRSK